MFRCSKNFVEPLVMDILSFNEINVLIFDKYHNTRDNQLVISEFYKQTKKLNLLEHRQGRWNIGHLK